MSENECNLLDYDINFMVADKPNYLFWDSFSKKEKRNWIRFHRKWDRKMRRWDKKEMLKQKEEKKEHE